MMKMLFLNFSILQKKRQLKLTLLNKSYRWDLNPRPPPYQGDALPAELLQHK